MAALPWEFYTVKVSDTLEPHDDVAWDVQPHLICLALTRGLAPTITQASLFWRFGRMKRTAGSPVVGVGQATDALMAHVEPFDLLGKWVLIESLTHPIRWYGKVIGDTEERWAQEEIPEGEPSEGEQRVKGGDQGFVAVGIEYFLGRVYIAGTSSREADKIKRPLGYNMGNGDGRELDVGKKANRKPPTDEMADPYDPLEFSTADDAIKWNAAAAVKHLLAEYPPRDNADDPSPIEFRLADAALPFLTWYHPEVKVEGRTVLEVLDELIHNENGLTWWLTIEWADPDFFAEIHVSSIATAAVDLPNIEDLDPAPVLPAALTITTFDPEAWDLAEPVEIERGKGRTWSRVRARGARRTSTLSAVGQDVETGVAAYAFPVDVNSTLSAGWTSARETEVLDGVRPSLDAPNQAIYDGLTESEQAAWNDRFRQSERFARVNRFINVNVVTSSGEELSPKIQQSTGSIVGDVTLTDEEKRGLRILRTTPLLSGVDYTDALAPVLTNAAPDGQTEFMPPVLLGYVPRGTGLWPVTMGEVLDGVGEDPTISTDGGWRFMDRLSHQFERVFPIDGEAADVFVKRFTLNCSLHTVAGFPGVVVNVSGGDQLQLGTLPDPEDAPTDAAIRESFKWQDFLVTCTIEWDAYCEGIWPEAVPSATPIEELLIQLGDRARFDWLVEGTVFDIDEHGHVKQCTTGGAVRDDRDLCAMVARVAYEWYREERCKVALQFRNTVLPFDVGTLITAIGTAEAAKTVNAVCSQITHNLETGTTSITLDYAELDFAGALT